MPQETDLIGIGWPSAIAHILGNQSQKLTCVGTAQAGAALIETNMVELTTSSGQTAAVIANVTNNEADIGSPYYVANTTATSALVFVPVGHTLNGSANASIAIAQNKAGYLIQTSLKNWYSVVSA